MSQLQNLYFKKNLLYLMEINGVNKAQLAAVLNITPTAVGKWTKIDSDALPSLENLITIADFFSVTLDALCKTDMQAADQEAGAEALTDKIDEFITNLKRIKEGLKKKERAVRTRVSHIRSLRPLAVQPNLV